MNEHLWDVQKARNYYKYATSFFKVIFGHTEQSLKVVDYLKHFQCLDFGYNRVAWFIIPYCIYYDNINNKPQITHEQKLRRVWAIWSINFPRFSDAIVVLCSDVSNTSFSIALMIIIKGFTKIHVLWIIINKHKYKLNRTFTMGCTLYPYWPVLKLYFILLE